MDLLRQPRIVFDEVPSEEPYSSISQGRPGGFLTIFKWSSYIASVFAPPQLPTDIAVAYIERKLPSRAVFKMILSEEPAVSVFLIAGAFIGCLIPVIGFIFCFCKYSGRCRSCCSCSSSKPRKKETCTMCCGRILSSVIVIITTLVVIGLTILISSHESLKTSTEFIREKLRANIKDVEAFVINSNFQLKFVIKNSYNKTADALTADLDGIEYILGKKLQNDLEEISQLEEAMHSLDQINDRFRSIGSRLTRLEKLRMLAVEDEIEAKIRLKIIRKDLNNLLQSCSLMDQLHCGTVTVNQMQLNISFKNISITQLLKSVKMVEMKNLTDVARKTRRKFANIPTFINKKTKTEMESIKNNLSVFANTFDDRLRLIDDIEYHSRKVIRQMNDKIEDLVSIFQTVEPIHRYIGMGLAAGIGVIALSLLNVTICVCCFPNANKGIHKQSNTQKLTGYSLTSSVTLIFFLSSFLWLMTLIIFFLGTQMHIFIWSPLHDEPSFKTLSKLLHNEQLTQQNGFLNNVFKNLKQEINIKNILRECKKEETIFSTLGLGSLMDIDKEFNIQRQLHLKNKLKSIRINVTQIDLTTEDSEIDLNAFLKSLNIDLTSNIQQLDRRLTKLNFKRFINNMQRVAGQLQSMETSAALFRLATKSRNFMRNILDPLQTKKDKLKYQISLLETDVRPLLRTIEGSVDHLHKFHNVLRLKGQSIVDKKLLDYTERLLSYVRQHSEHLRHSFNHKIAKCGPVWQIFESARTTICSSSTDPMNSLWISSLFCLLLFLPLLYVNLKLSLVYLGSSIDINNSNLINDLYQNCNGMQSSFSSNQSSNNLWVTPGSNRRIHQASQNTTIVPQENIAKIIVTEDFHDHHYDRIQRDRLSILCPMEESNYNRHSACPPDCQHHITAHTNSVVLPHLMHTSNHLEEFGQRRMPILPSFNARRFQEHHLQAQRNHVMFIPHKRKSQQRSVSQDSDEIRGILTVDDAVIVQPVDRYNPDIPQSLSEKIQDWQRRDSDVVAISQLTAWKEAALAGADFVTPEFVAIQVRKTPLWVKSFWELDPRSIAKKYFFSKDANAKKTKLNLT